MKGIRKVLAGKGEFYKYDVFKDGVTQSLLNTFFDCEKKTRYYLRGLKSNSDGSSKAIRFGNMWHDLQEYVLNGRSEHLFMNFNDFKKIYVDICDKVWEDRHADVYELLAPDKQKEYELDWKLVINMTYHYFDKYQDDFGNNLALKAEIEIKNFKIKGIPIRGKLDGLVLNLATNQTTLLEHKTKSRFDISAIQLSLPNNFQVLFYLMYLNAIGAHSHRVLYNVVRKPLLVRSKNESLPEYITRVHEDIKKRPDFYFIRLEQHYSTEKITEFRQIVEAKIGNFGLWANGNEQLDLRNTSKCQGVYGACQYLEYCHSDEKDHFNLTIKEKLFSELA
jgi:hypothetical protein